MDEKADANELSRLRAAISSLRARAHEAVIDYPGSLVLYEPIALADALTAILDNGDTSATDARNDARGKAVLAAMRMGRVAIAVVSPTVGTK